jgi:hypothetical protein
MRASESESGSKLTELKDVSSDSKVSLKPQKVRPLRKRSKSNLLVKDKYWSHVRIVAPGQDRTNARSLDFILSTVLFSVTLFSKSVLIESSFMKNPEIDAELSFPIDASFSSCDLKDLYTKLIAIKGFRSTLTNTVFDTSVNQGTSPFTASMMTLPFRLLGFKPIVIRRMLSSLVRVLIDKGLDGDCLNLIEDRYSIGTIITRVNTIKDTNQVSFYANGIVLSKSLVREIRPILMEFCTPERPTGAYLFQVKRYLFIILSALSLLDRFLTDSLKVEKG